MRPQAMGLDLHESHLSLYSEEQKSKGVGLGLSIWPASTSHPMWWRGTPCSKGLWANMGSPVLTPSISRLANDKDFFVYRCISGEAAHVIGSRWRIEQSKERSTRQDKAVSKSRREFRPRMVASIVILVTLFATTFRISSLVLQDVLNQSALVSALKIAVLKRVDTRHYRI